MGYSRPRISRRIPVIFANIAANTANNLRRYSRRYSRSIREYREYSRKNVDFRENNSRINKNCKNRGGMELGINHLSKNARSIRDYSRLRISPRISPRIIRGIREVFTVFVTICGIRGIRGSPRISLSLFALFVFAANIKITIRDTSSQNY